ncbi:hypothetical protein S40288_01145 [Stachybotrys chartarum IBT 40288]|nr:hypothetical protein S40288_01145 [Stachybotrys chartarum IBT 40288]
MIWYLLYPLRGTTEAPALPPSHPVRSCFARYGRYAASHAVTTLLISAAAATSLIYPIPFLFTTDFTNGASNLPHHVWTVAQPVPYNIEARPDVIMRSIWVHGSYMQALDTELLTSALELQDELLGPTEDFSPRQLNPEVPPDGPVVSLTPAQRDAVHVINGLTNQSWFFHSPLLYWGCSRQRIVADHDIVSTVNDKKNQSTSVNVTLRHSIVFSGKRFEDRRLLSADALVITLLHLQDSPVGALWEAKAAELPIKFGHKWDVYPPDGRISTSRLYEFQFRPMSWQDSIFLTLAYSITAFYFLMSLSKLRAFKSKVGLMITVMTQITLSIMSSFTVCAVFNIDLSRIPRIAYPLVILTMSLENIFRLINAVITRPSEDSTSNRIGHAFGETSHIALVSTVQNVAILLSLSRVVSPGVAAFCIFAAVALVVDFYLLSTFFLSVLSLDVRRMELSDALEKETMQQNLNTTHPKGRSTWLQQLLQGNVALSTRIAGTIVMVGFVMIVQWHFLDEDNLFRSLVRLFRGAEATHLSSPAKTSLLENIHQARSPTSWLRLQDHETAREVINIIKPSSHSYVARVYDPLVFVMKNSDRMPHAKEPALLPAAYDFIHHQMTRFVVIIFVVVAALRLLTNYLLWEDEASNENPHDANAGSLLAVRSLSGGHALDIAMLISSSDGHVVSVGLDRVIRVWDVRSGGSSYAISDASSAGESPFPVLALAVDDESRWLAILTSFRVIFWDLVTREWGPSAAVDHGGQRPEAFFFNPGISAETPNLVLVRRNGTLTELRGNLSHEMEDFAICRSPLVSARPLAMKGNDNAAGKIMIVTASRRGCVHVAQRQGCLWTSKEIPVEGPECHDIHQVLTLPALRVFMIASRSRIHLLGADDHEVINTFLSEEMQPRSLQCAYRHHRSSKPGAEGLTILSLCYTAAESGDCVMQSYVPCADSQAISLQPGAAKVSKGWCAWAATREVKRHVKDPGIWDVLRDGSVLGIRKTTAKDALVRPKEYASGGKLRRRVQGRENRQTSLGHWEVWTIPPATRTEADETRPLLRKEEQNGHLIISELGPRARIGQMSLAVGFGDVIKIVTVGQERYKDDSHHTGQEPLLNIGSRRRRPGGGMRPRAWS